MSFRFRGESSIDTDGWEWHSESGPPIPHLASESRAKGRRNHQGIATLPIDPLVLTLLFLVFFEMRFSPLRKASDHLGFLSLAWVSNFIVIPALAWVLAVLFFGSQPDLYAGLLLYLLFPCTDWFLAFTRIAGGDVALGSVLIPINLISQLLLFPIYLALFIGSDTSLDLIGIGKTFGQWFLIPLLLAMSVRFLLSKLLGPDRFEPIPRLVGSLVPSTLSVLVFCIFSFHSPQLVIHS